MKKNRTIRAFLPNDTVESGEYISFNLSINQPAFIYIVQFFPDHSRRVLFSSIAPIQTQTPMNHNVRVPPDPHEWLLLDDATGEEHVYIIASRDAIENASNEIAKLINDIRTSPREAARATPPKRKLAIPRTDAGRPTIGAKPNLATPGDMEPNFIIDRALQPIRITEDGQVVYQDIANDPSVNVFRFSFRHVAPSASSSVDQ
ncbi:DUF4384 domain-containing protein [Sorangium sp. So ce861]|uniref:DUF4384 domain-containing protein n=1 Tax=Sorangium sp. So ce861 TaxID=3133323 RepID=UPI003F5E30F6